MNQPIVQVHRADGDPAPPALRGDGSDINQQKRTKAYLWRFSSPDLVCTAVGEDPSERSRAFSAKEEFGRGGGTHV